MSKKKIDRRKFLKLTGVSTSPLLISQRSVASTEKHNIQFDKVVNIVEDYGADNTGTEPIDNELSNAVGPDVLIKFPDGEYLIENEQLISPAGNIGFIAKDGANPTLIPKDGFNDYLLNIYHLPKALFKGIDIDLRADNTTAGLRFDIENRFHIEDVEYIGRGTHSDEGVTSALVLAVTESSGTGIIRNVKALKGSAIGHYKNGDGRIGAYVGSSSYGKIRFENCQFEEFGNNGLYCGRTNSKIQVVGGTYRNNNVSQVRIAGDGSYVKNALIEVDLDKYTGPYTLTENAYNTRGVVIDAGGIEKTPGALVKDCKIEITNADNLTAATYVANWKETVKQELCIENTDINITTNNTNPSAIYSEGGPVNTSNVTITGNTDGDEVIKLLNLASNSNITDTCINEKGENRNGIVADGADNCTVKNSNINVSGDPIITKNGGDITTENVTYDQDCSSSLTVTTEQPTDITKTSTTLNGSLTDLGDSSSADCYFEWGTEGNLSNTTQKTSLSQTDTFSETLSNLKKSTTYEYRAVAIGSNGNTTKGSTITFTTKSEEKAPNIDKYNVTEAGSPNPHTEITADWAVSDTDGNLDNVTVTVKNNNKTVKQKEYNISGETANNKTQFKIKHSNNQTFTVLLTVTDTTGNQETAKKKVTE